MEADIGSDDGPGTESFLFYVCTPSKLSRIVQAKQYRWGRPLLVVQRFSWEVVERAVADLCAGIDRESWDEIVTYLTRFVEWEYDDLDRVPAGPDET